MKILVPTKLTINTAKEALEEMAVEALMMAERFEGVEAIIGPSFAGSLLLITNHTGHPSLTLRAGLREDGTPRGITMIGRRFDEGTLLCLGMAVERELDVWHARPALAEG